MGVKIITDSASDLPIELIKELDIEVMPLIVYLDEKEYTDGVTLMPDDLYGKMRDGSKVRTAQVTAASMESVFKKNSETDDDIFYIAFSSELSGTYQTSELIKNDLIEENANIKLNVFNTKCASLGEGLVVYYAAKLAKEGADITTVIKKTKEYAVNMEHIFTVDNLEYLYRGGRVSRGSAVMGTMLNIKPILTVEDGKLVPIEKIRSRKKSLKRIIDIVGEKGQDLSNQVVAISHADDLEAANFVKDALESKYGVKDFIVNNIGCAIGAHAGPGTLAVFFLK